VSDSFRQDLCEAAQSTAAGHDCDLAKKMRVVVSGAAGFIGSHLCERLLSAGHAVVGLDNFVTGSRQNIRRLNRLASDFQFFELDVTESVGIEGRVDAVAHLASLASPRDYLTYPVETLEAGSIGTQVMLELAVKHHARFLLTSTSECYGDPLVHPQVETYWGNVNPVGPRSCYDESKRYAEAITMAYHRKYGLRTNIARIFNTYGPRMKLNDGRVVPAFLDQALRGAPMTIFGTGLQTRSLCYVSDLVEGLCRLMRSEEREPVNLGNPQEVTILELAEKTKALTETKSQIVFGPPMADDPQRRRPDIEKARRVLGWEPTVSLEEGLKRTLESFRKQILPQDQPDDPTKLLPAPERLYS
jgi:dTDP-glucose 4,6-dehydratase